MRDAIGCLHIGLYHTCTRVPAQNRHSSTLDPHSKLLPFHCLKSHPRAEISRQYFTRDNVVCEYVHQPRVVSKQRGHSCLSERGKSCITWGEDGERPWSRERVGEATCNDSLDQRRQILHRLRQLYEVRVGRVADCAACRVSAAPQGGPALTHIDAGRLELPWTNVADVARDDDLLEVAASQVVVATVEG